MKWGGGGGGGELAVKSYPSHFRGVDNFCKVGGASCLELLLMPLRGLEACPSPGIFFDFFVT